MGAVTEPEFAVQTHAEWSWGLGVERGRVRSGWGPGSRACKGWGEWRSRSQGSTTAAPSWRGEHTAASSSLEGLWWLLVTSVGKLLGCPAGQATGVHADKSYEGCRAHAGRLRSSGTKAAGVPCRAGPGGMVTPLCV